MLVQKDETDAGKTDHQAFCEEHFKPTGKLYKHIKRHFKAGKVMERRML